MENCVVLIVEHLCYDSTIKKTLRQDTFRKTKIRTLPMRYLNFKVFAGSKAAIKQEVFFLFQTIRQVARYLEIPEAFVRRLVAQGVCPGVYSGNRFLVNTEALREYLDNESRQIKEVQV